MTPDRPPPSIDRLYELLADHSTVGLTPEEQDELRELLVKWPHVDPRCLDEAAAAYQLAVIDDHGPDLPLALMTRLEADAASFLRLPTGPSGTRSKNTPPLLAWSGWAIAACLLVAIGWRAWPKPSEPELTVVQKRDRLVAENSSRFASKREVNRASGEVVWNAEKQEGYIEVRGLPPNDRTKRQYQLWVVDRGRPTSPPVDGGVFDVDANGDAVVPVRTPIPVRVAAAFAVTDEEVGGVVVSEDGKKGRFALLMTPVEP
jgi:hypothetical protein